ncbi:MAG TPA: DNA polymerase III subunit gamma/tau, partial [Deltaproteobacteria bacterium]|nr:DNA polymerase III subunit gamma/tau [Deltaproteobacteria bacterium]
ASIFSGDCQAVLECVKQVDTVGYNMRQFGQELIEHFRNLLVVRSVKKPEEILDLAEAEMVELCRQAEGVPAGDIQRRLTLMIKADAEMAFASFPRFVLEIALLKAAMLETVIPLQELIEKVKALETSAVHTPVLPWDAGRMMAQDVSPRQVQVRETHHKPSHAPTIDVPIPAQPQVSGHSAWERFVKFVVAKSPADGSILEHGSPLKFEEGCMEIGFPAGSYYLSSLQDPQSLAELQALANEFSGKQTTVRIVSITPETGGAPQTLAEKKKSDDLIQQEQLRQEVAANPVINEALRIFGGTITDVRKI